MQNFLKNSILRIIFTGLIVFFLTCKHGSVKSNNQTLHVNGNKIVVYAASSLTDVLSEIIDSFEIRYKAEITTNMASSGTLARQIEQGGSPDVYISANEKWAAYIDSLGYIKNGLKKIIGNELVLVAPKDSKLEIKVIDSTLNLRSLFKTGRLSIGDPSHVPAGKYATQAMIYYGLNKQLTDKIIFAKDVRSALLFVEIEESPLGIVYKTDAVKSNNVKIVNTFPAKSHEPIVYVAGLCTNNRIARDFMQFITSPEMVCIWDKYGFKK